MHRNFASIFVVASQSRGRISFLGSQWRQLGSSLLSCVQIHPIGCARLNSWMKNARQIRKWRKISAGAHFVRTLLSSRKFQNYMHSNSVHLRDTKIVDYFLQQENLNWKFKWITLVGFLSLHNNSSPKKPKNITSQQCQLLFSFSCSKAPPIPALTMQAPTRTLIDTQLRGRISHNTTFSDLDKKEQKVCLPERRSGINLERLT